MAVDVSDIADHSSTEPFEVRPRKLASLDGVPHVIPYQGSKRALAHVIVPLIPDDVSTMYEPFAGSAAVAVATAYSGKATDIQISDVNEPLMRLWDRIINDPFQLARAYERLWNQQLDDPRSYYVKVRNEFNASREPHYLLYLLARCVKAAVRYNKSGDFNQGADNRRLGARPKAMHDRIVQTSATMTGAVARTSDYASVLITAKRDDLVYMDPPYEGVTNVADHRYMSGLDRASFVAVLEEAVANEVSFMISYDGMLGNKQYGTPLPAHLELLHLHLHAGRSSQSTLAGTSDRTVESLYLSPALVARLGGHQTVIDSLEEPTLLFG
jgi:DNA adenine methylase